MTRASYRFDKVEQKMIPLSEWNEKYGKRSRNPQFYIQPDIQPYVAVTGDMQGKVIDGRAAHRSYLARNNLVEVGNEQEYMTKNGGMADDNPNLKSDRQHEDEVCRSLMTNLEKMRQR